MVNEQTLQGNWNEIKGKLRNKWGQLTNDDLQQARGNIDQLIGLIQRKTGEARSSVEKFLEEATAGGAGALNEAAETAREYAQQAMETVQERTKQRFALSTRAGNPRSGQSPRFCPINTDA